MIRFIPIFVSIFIAEAAGFIGSFFTTASVQGWYLTLAKPAWNPPSWVFGPVWTTLFALMGIAAGMVWARRSVPGARGALWAYGIQLVLNVAWSFLFFNLQSPGAAFVEIIFLLTAIIVTTILFWKVYPMAGVLLLPYIAWVSFAAFLNYTIWQLN